MFEPIKSALIPNHPLYAEVFYNLLKEHLLETQDRLDKDEELRVYYYDQAGNPILIKDIGYHNPSLIILYGQDTQRDECHILLHLQSVQLITKIEKITDKIKAGRLGFLGEVK